MNKFFSAIVLSFIGATVVGCCSYSELKIETPQAKIHGCTPIASYEVVNLTHKLLGIVPLTTGVTWKEGPYDDTVGSIAFFRDRGSLDDNLESVRHACKIVGSDEIRAVTGRVDTYWFWSLFLIEKTVYKTSCIIVK